MDPLTEDALHVAATRPALLLGLPMPLALVLGLGGAEIQIAVHGLAGVAWGSRHRTGRIARLAARIGNTVRLRRLWAGWRPCRAAA